jgi:signal transduction histidine kinase
MTLRSKLFIINAALLGSLLVLAGASLWGLRSQREHVEASLAEYQAMQLVESAEVKVISAKARLHEAGINPAEVAVQFKAALDDLRKYKAVLSSYDTFLPAEIPASQKTDAKLKTKLAVAKLTALLAMFDEKDEAGKSGLNLQRISMAADALAMELADLLRVCNTFLNQTELTSHRDLQRSTFTVAVLAGAIPLLALLASLWQYRRIMVPMDRLRRWSRQIAGGDFLHPYQASGDREFLELGQDFNTMAAELHAFYKRLEEMVAAKSKELVRSERLASVGYLAAGVAHEINNPLNIMSGYAELAVKRLRRSLEPDVVAEVITTLGVIREEAFRCKEITRKLLSLAKSGNDGRETVSMTRVASEVAVMVRGLTNFRGRRLDVAIDPTEPLFVEANLVEMKQVLLNLVVNALEAVRPGTGEVKVEGRRNGAWVELAISDNGRGMNRETLDRVFEPFYTNKRGAGEPGTGLGLSITHAIVADHGGQIHAGSDGPDRGSRFTIRLPARESAREPEEPSRKIESRSGQIQEQVS